VAAGTATTASNAETTWLVLAKQGASTQAIANQLKAQGARVTSVNSDIGLVTVSSANARFSTRAKGISGVEGVAKERSIGSAPRQEATPDQVERENLIASQKAGAKSQHSRSQGKKKPHAAPVAPDPLDSKLWGMAMIHAGEAHNVSTGSHKVMVGVLDTGIQADHPDLAPNVDVAKSRNFTIDLPDIDGDTCEHLGCTDPATEDDNGHGTHVAGTIAAALNGRGLSGVAPNVTLVNIRGGQDSGFFFLSPVVNALTYAGDIGIDVVNMSFYVDPWLYNCRGGAPEDTPEQAADQALIITAMNRALNFAHKKNVTLVGALGNEHTDLANPLPDATSPDYPLNTSHPRTIDNAKCFDLPVEGPHVLGISALGPSGKKSDFSNYTTDLTSGELEFSAPGGWFRDGFGTPTFRTNENLILSTASLISLQQGGLVDDVGNVTPDGVAVGVIKDCPTATSCAYYEYLQGTSMASPHAVGVAALAVATHGTRQGSGLTMKPDQVARLMARTATDHPCPPGGVQDYTNEGRPAEFTATCVGTMQNNGFYGAGIVNALGVVDAR
jgi:subtilisin family serine protease